MSMNLCFNPVGGTAHIEFPYQTRTEVTYAVIAAPTLEEKIEIIRKDLYSHINDDVENREWIEQLFVQCEEMMRDSTIELDYI